ncbi:nuclear transport factor 2 family protein [Aquimarina sp. RZ0]|uniref:nuclear transport factor 2 family protein n=1 Tax=Aquimarina sp. RZ0 TaxID=2607730 RepID=UPI0011F16AC9|nr:nuclear transport factor 2 family protein [Aquimarina sp. RZ0]KAA1241568.1 hypothetical protein F0000_26425 [Aquimarina sp. RZ0]
MKKTIFIGLITLFTASIGFSQTKEQNAIKQTIISFSKAADKNDTKALDTYLDDNYRVVMNRLFGSKKVVVLPKSAYLDKIRTKEWGGDTRKVTFENVIVNNTAASAKVIFKGTKATFVSLINMVKDTNGNWKLISDTPMVK